MITDLDRNLLIPSLAEVLTALKSVPPPYTYAPSVIKVPIRRSSEELAAMQLPAAHLSTPVMTLEKLRIVVNGRESETWRVASMPEFHIGEE